MKFIVDAQLPQRIAVWLRQHGHDTLHTLDLPDANRTTDAQIVELAMSDDRAVVTKDADFVESFILHSRPEKLLLISTGNISHAELEQLLLPQLPAIAAAFETADFIEVSRFGVMLHD